ncbi:2-oxo acid dehydrogenase subunit E2 [Buchnera aphidicola]|uniref:Dihydrolipoamide acetyltransferase component of pyruvate dehydrogenase complex n=1 Tax=Buchnera aphidicola (Therioaphis trifolii) TaxID=1241884 RepID=A0A4D6YB47_9GAMM|nr:2-oxo acid dehydrogenase subunit E2 [Buchnera aphidicola]QCI27147.1 hypothetical protein D9V81_00745 [Buchnera aphidicola (Therioaphis trifolii)]
MDTEIKIPDIGIDHAEIVDILVSVNDIIKKEQSVIVIEGEKASMEIPSPYEGKIKEIKVKVSDIVQKDSVIMIIENINNSIINQDASNCVVNESLELNNTNYIIHASPLIRRLSRSLNIDLKNISGSGRKNRIIKQDIDKYIKNISKNNISSTFNNNNNNISKNFDFSKFGSVEIIKLNKIKKISGKLLSKNWTTIPHVTQFDEVDITDLENFRIKYNKTINHKKNNKLTLLTFIIKAVSKGLEKFPYFNSSISIEDEIIFLKKYINIGIAVNTIHGLLVPVIKHVNKKTLSDIAIEILEKSNQARKGELKISDLQGGCFTISSLGGIGGINFTPIINSSEAAILGVSKFTYKPVWNGTSFIPKLILPLSLSYDHRIIDGVEGAQFITFINTLLSDIRLLLI